MSEKALVIAHLHPFLASDRVTKEYDAGTTIDAILKDLQPMGAILVSVNGDHTSDYAKVVQAGDHVVVKALPAGEGASAAIESFQKVAAIALIIGGLAFAIPTGGASLGVTAAGVGLLFVKPIATALAGALYQAAGGNKPSDPVYGVSGGSNSEAKWGKVPVVFGKHLIVPPYAVKPWTEISTSSGGTDGDTQYLHLMYCIGVGPMKISNLKFGDTMLAPNASAVKNGPITDIVNFSDITIQVYDDGTSPSLYPNTVIEDRVGTTIKYATEKVMTTAKNIDKFSVEISFPSGLYAYSSAGSRVNRTVHVEARYRTAGSGTAWSLMTPMPFFSGDNHEITKNDPEILRFTSSVSGLPLPEVPVAYEVIVKRLNVDMTTDDKGADTIRWDVLRSERTSAGSADPAYYRPILAATAAKLCIVAMKVKANESISGTVDSFSCLAEPQYHVYSGSGTGSAQWTLGYSKNPAVAYLAALRGTMNPRPIADADIDWVRLEAWYNTCNTKGWECNAVVGSGERLFDMLAKIAATGRARPLIRDGKYSVVVDEAKTTIVQHFTPRNSSGFTWTKSFPDYPHALRVSFISDKDDYSQVDRIVCDTGYTEATATEFHKSSMWGVTDPSLISKHGYYQLAVAHSRAEVYSFDTSAESIVCELGDLIVCTHDVPMFGLQSARVKAVTLNGSSQATAITVDESITQESGKTYAVRYRRGSDNTSVLATLSTVVGVGYELTFATPISASTVPAIDDLVLFGESGSESVRLIVAGIEPGENMEAKIYAVDEAPGVHTADSGTIPAWDAHISKPANFGVKEAVGVDINTPTARPQPGNSPAIKMLSSLDDTGDYEGQYGVYLNVQYRWQGSLTPDTGLYPSTVLYPSSVAMWVMADEANAKADLLDEITTNLQEQIDGQITTWFQTTDPRDNVPTPWGGVGTDESHKADIWYDTTPEAQKASRWTGSAWLEIEDANLLAALERISALEEAVDGKITSFASRPLTGPYSIGDIWYDTASRVTYACVTARATGVAGLLSDWSVVTPKAGDFGNKIWDSRDDAEYGGAKVGDEYISGIDRYRCTYASDYPLWPAETQYPGTDVYPVGHTWVRITAKRWPDATEDPGGLAELVIGDTYYNTADYQYRKYDVWGWEDDGPALTPAGIGADPAGTAATAAAAAQAAAVAAAPKYLGKYYAAHPSTYNANDWWLVYDTDDSPIQRGVWYSNAGTPARITTSSSADLQAKLVSALSDIAWAEANSYGTSAAYGGFDAFFEALGVVTAFIQKLFAQEITLTGTGFIQSTNFAESGGYATAGVKIDAATGAINSKSGKFVSADIKDATITNATVTGKATLSECVIKDLTAGNNIIKESNSEVNTSTYSSYVLKKTIQICASGTIRVMFDFRSGSNGSTGWVGIYKNGSLFYERSTSSMTYSTSTESMNVDTGDIVGLYLKGPTDSFGVYAKNFSIRCAENPGILKYIGDDTWSA